MQNDIEFILYHYAVCDCVCVCDVCIVCWARIARGNDTGNHRRQQTEQCIHWM